MEPWKQELYHHGILGMRWGKRNGPPYPLSPGDHSASEKKAGWRKSLNEYKERAKERAKEYDEKQLKDLYSMSAKEYKNTYQSSQKKDRKKFEKYGSLSRWDTLTDKQKKAIIAAGLVTAGVVTAAYLYKRHGEQAIDYVDDAIIKNGTTLQTLSMDPDRIKTGEHFYTAYLKGDTQTYLSEFSRTANGFKSKILTTVIDDMKVASPKTIQTELENFTKKLGKTEEGMEILRKFKSSSLREMLTTPLGIPMVAREPADPKLVTANINLMLHDDNFGWNSFTREYIRHLNYMYEGSVYYDEKAMPFVKEFYKHLKEKGYSALKDYNDMSWTREPTIVFDRTKLGESVVKEITKKEVRIADAKEFLNNLPPSTISNLLSDGSLYVSTVTGLGVLGTAEYNVNRRKNNKETEKK